MKHPRIVGVALVVGVVALFVGLSFVTVARHFEMHGLVVTDPIASCSGVSTLEGTPLSFHWWAASNISFAAWSCSPFVLVYGATGTNGSDELTSVGGEYMFGSLCTHGGCVPANVSGVYTAYLLTL